jgi:GDP-D-mannose dehydratase
MITVSSRVPGILFNHESPRRGADFVTKKIHAKEEADEYVVVNVSPK